MIKPFKEILQEASIEAFMSKVNSCQTLDGLDELDKYYKKRIKDAELADSDDITVRDALAGRRLELDVGEDDDEEEF
ncbi:DNA helicase [Yersinia phage vB_YenM_TG1]|uniref:DNA helicase n=1 Tax=Yersinia phage vB_YenM_TG1 TaxID=1589265 RepID=A0A0B4ZZL8_9CAUD|nr:DNA helicase [Yersinia phage vB_YenM_TG1]AJD81993.1 DNA helicase [Yersinia phage vB_YenM_TG1]